MANTKSESPEMQVVHEFEGRDQQVTPLFKLKAGLAVFRLTHDGQDEFAVNMLDKDGETVELDLIYKDGKFNGAKALKIKQPGFYLLDIQADGKWTVKIEQVAE